MGDGTPAAWRGEVPAGGEHGVALAIDAAELAVGAYRVAVLVERADGSQQDEVEVELTVEPGKVAVEPAAPAAPGLLVVAGVFPNPATAEAAVRLRLTEPSRVRVTVYDVLGRAVAVVEAGRLEPGRHAVALDASALAPGVYVVRATAGLHSAARRLTVVR